MDSETIDPELLLPEISIDLEIDFPQITPKFHRIINQFEPFGPLNMTPIFMSKNIYDTGPVVGKSMAMQEIYKLISRLVNTNLNLLILGESGTGKKLIAKSMEKST